MQGSPRLAGTQGSPRLTAALALILAITLIDMLVNAILTPYTWLIAGAVLGFTERVSAGDEATEDQPAGTSAKPARRRPPKPLIG